MENRENKPRSLEELAKNLLDSLDKTEDYRIYENPANFKDALISSAAETPCWKDDREVRSCMRAMGYFAERIRRIRYSIDDGGRD